MDWRNRPGEVNCIFTKALIPFLERRVGPPAVEAVCRSLARQQLSAAKTDELLRLLWALDTLPQAGAIVAATKV